MSYIKSLLTKKSVIILEIEHLAKLLGIKDDILKKMINGTGAFYYRFSIPKRSGGMREIAAPYPILMQAQRWINDNLLSIQPTHSAATGFISGKSIKDNAYIHLNSKNILKIDLKDFFPSIGINRVIAIFLGMGYTPRISYYLASLCCLNGVLPQGAPTSPTLSNLIAKRIDYRIHGFTTKNNLQYSRYADDIIISGDNVTPQIFAFIKKIITTEGFIINEDKVHFMKEHSQRIITGLSISNKKITVPKINRRTIRQELHYINIFGLKGHMERKKINDPIYGYRLLGYLQFWKSIEPENIYVQQSIDNLNKALSS